MFRILLDNRAAIDLFLPRDHATRMAMAELLHLLDARKDELLLAATSLCEVSRYVECSVYAVDRWRTTKERVERSARAREFLLEHVTVVPVDELVCRRAQTVGVVRDFENVLVAECAVTCGADVVLSGDADAAPPYATVPWLSVGELTAHLKVRR